MPTQHNIADLGIIETLMRLAYRTKDPEGKVTNSDIEMVLLPLEAYIRQAKAECVAAETTPIYCELWKSLPIFRIFGVKQDIKNSKELISFTDGEGVAHAFCGIRCLLQWLAPQCGVDLWPAEEFSDRRQ